MRLPPAVLIPLLLLTACSSVTKRHDGAWRHNPRPPAAVHDVALGVFRDLGYDVTEDRAEGAGFRIAGRYEADDVEIEQAFECRPAGGESEIRLRTVSVYDESEAARAQGAHERLIDRIENELRKKE
jgi:hypothetical protein